MVNSGEGSMSFDQFPEERPSKLVDPPSIPELIATAVAAAVDAQAQGEDLHKAALQAVKNAD